MGIMCIRTVAKNKKTKQAMNDYIVLEQNSTQKNKWKQCKVKTQNFLGEKIECNSNEN